MTKKIYKTREDALKEMENNSSVKCIKLVLEEDVFEVPLKSFIRTFGPDDMGTIIVKFTYSHSKPMMWVGDWYFYNYFEVDVIESKWEYPNFKETWEPLFDSMFKDREIERATEFGHFIYPIEDELKFLSQICNLDGEVSVSRIRWKNKN